MVLVVVMQHGLDASSEIEGQQGATGTRGLRKWIYTLDNYQETSSLGFTVDVAGGSVHREYCVEYK